MLALLVLLIGGCSNTDKTSGTAKQSFREGTLSSSSETTETTNGLTGTSGSGHDILLRVGGGKKIRFSGICTVGDREYVISGTPAKTYSFKDVPLSCRLQKQDSGRGSLKVTLVSGSSTRSVQQTNAKGGIVDISHGNP